MRISPPERLQPTSTSIEGSVKGKKDGRNRVLTSSTSKKACQEFLQDPLQVPEVAVAVDDEPFTDGTIGVWVASESQRLGPPGMDHADRRASGFPWVRICTGEVWVRRKQPAAILLRIEEEGVMHFAGRMIAGKFRAVKL